MKNVFKSKKGVALEMSIIFLLTVFLLCGIIAALSFMVTNQGIAFTKEQNQKIALDKLANSFVSAVQAGEIDETSAEAFVERKMNENKLTDGYDFYVSVSGSNASLIVFTTRTTDKQENSGESLDEEVVVNTGKVLYLLLENNQVVKWAYN